MVFLKGPIGCCVTEFVTNVLVNLSRNKHLNNFSMTFTSSNVKTSEALLVLFFRFTVVSYKSVQHIDHVPECGLVQGGIAANIIVLCNVNLRLVLNQNVDDRRILCFNCRLNSS